MSPQRPGRPCDAPGCPLMQPCPVHARMKLRRISSARRGYGYAWQKRRARWLRAHPLCAVCGQVATDVDHVVALRMGGMDDESNYQSLCHRHHSMKTAMSGVWR